MHCYIHTHIHIYISTGFLVYERFITWGSLQLTPIIMVKTGDAAMFAIGFIFIIEASDTIVMAGCSA